ncbi:4-(cytidine 5'-diphospho)-2-C-methyl-D-erythritol kinase [Microbacter margulisiae]|uniref:4-diphosphocytidyl-2-C-methyl-D-erythritol kinase n=1 Tax=Microbacter margulisiae TaxID=1350067 RepID=A0A7W5H1K2_9PORP|nr:4-(cytidine 5'-diphospho)-2-C-methyl-D-erythritol kinase [Microbacter margulisiae]MBB3186456.1 4-diphosphocytidyl-2-C-methyl-D-erythritol kinase [Microbacter margulisiae]
MLCFPNAKINIGLNIVEKRTDGFHNIETVFYPISLCDALEIIPANKTSLTISGIELSDQAHDNLVIKAFNMVKVDFDLPELSIFLHKNIPLGAGLGGGSSDAAAMIRLLNKTFALGLGDDQMENYAAKLGSDCAFFIRNVPAYATQRGEILAPVELDLAAYLFVVIKPPVHISTREAYGSIIPKKQNVSVNELIKHPIETWKNTIVNDFESVMFSKYPKLNDIKTMLYNKGALYAAMSGSGSAIFGIFPSGDIPKIDLPDCFVWIHQPPQN